MRLLPDAPAIIREEPFLSRIAQDGRRDPARFDEPVVVDEFDLDPIPFRLGIVLIRTDGVDDGPVGQRCHDVGCAGVGPDRRVFQGPGP